MKDVLLYSFINWTSQTLHHCMLYTNKIHSLDKSKNEMIRQFLNYRETPIN